MSQIEELKGLSPRQLEVFEFLVEGYSNKAIAAYLNISPQSVKNHVSGICAQIRPEGGFGDKWSQRTWLTAWYWKQVCG